MFEKFNADRVYDCLYSLVETFNNCNCCPLSEKCDYKGKGDIDYDDCADKIYEWIKK